MIIVINLISFFFFSSIYEIDLFFIKVDMHMESCVVSKMIPLYPKILLLKQLLFQVLMYLSKLKY